MIELDNAAYSQPAAADLDGSPGEETIVAEGQALRVFRPDGTSYVLSSPLEASFQDSFVQLEDLDGDSRPEVLAIGRAWGEATLTDYLFAWRQDGQQLTPAFPIAMASESVDDFNFGLLIHSAPRVLVGDVDGDAVKEILYAEAAGPTSFRLRLVGSDGAQRPGWTAPTLPGFPQMALADLDRDGSAEILVADAGAYAGLDSALHQFRADGSERPGWPKQLGAWGVVVGDLDRDGRDEIVFRSGGGIQALREDGSPLSDAWPLPPPEGWLGMSLTLADVNGDGLPEVLVTEVDSREAPYPTPAASAIDHDVAAARAGGRPRSRRQVRRDGAADDGARSQEAGPHAYPEQQWEESRLLAIDASGQVVRSWRLLGARGAEPDAFYAAVTAGDFDRDGTLDLAIVHQSILAGGWIGEGALTVLTTGAPYAASSSDWPSLFHDTRNTASALRREAQPPSVTLTSPASGAVVTGPVTVAADARDDVGVAGVRFMLDGVELGPEDTDRPFAVVWDARSSSEGKHALTAVARDTAGHTAVSAPIEVAVARDTAPPTVNIGTPTEGETVVGKLTAHVEADDDRGVASIELWIDDVLRATSTSSPLEFLWDTTAEAEGEHHVMAKAHDGALNVGVAGVTVMVPSPLATYDATLRVPRCVLVGNVCDTSGLLDGRGTLGPEPHMPNTIGCSCVDQSSGRYHFDESNDRIRVFTVDGAPFRRGRTVKVEATVWAYSAFWTDKLDLYYAADASNPGWTFLTTLTPAVAGKQVLSATYTLPAGPLQAVRARFRYYGSPAPCSRDSYNDYDDLVFAVGED